MSLDFNDDKECYHITEGPSPSSHEGNFSWLDHTQCKPADKSVNLVRITEFELPYQAHYPYLSFLKH